MFSSRLSLSIGLAALALTAGAATASAETIQVSDGTVVGEGAAGDHIKTTFIVTRHRVFGEAEQGGYSVTTSNGTAVEDADFLGAVLETLSGGNTACASAEGCTESDAFQVEVVGDNVPEGEENFFVNLTAPNMTVTDAQGMGTIIDDDGPARAPAAPASPAAPVSTTAPATVAAPMTVAAPAAAAAPARVAAEEDVVAPAIGMVFRGLRGNIARVRVQCPKDEIRCVGRLAVQLNEKTMASAPFRLRGGQTKLLRVRLKPKQRRTLHDAGVVYLKASAFDAAGNRGARVLSFQL